MNQGSFLRFSIRGGAVLRVGLALCLAIGGLQQAGYPQTVAKGNPSLPPAATRQVDFVKDIQAILAANCYACHGPEKQKGDLRWDVKSSVFKNGDHGPILSPGKSAESRVIKLVVGLDPETVMPPRGERLTPAQIGLLRAWIDQGATWVDIAVTASADKRNHWAFKPPVRPQLPTVKHKSWIRNPIDDFVLARLEKEHLRPAPEADRSTLIRRLSLDLTGLPPTPREVDQFLADHQPGAYERLVERLLASPHYGERWGRVWLDLARYADTNGYEKDRPRSIWPYRDWVIDAFNRDLPYDQFVIDQLAGDLLPDPTSDQRVATGFLRNSMLNQEGGIEPEQFRVEALVDRMDTLGKSFLGLTVNCCQCHNHKFDPFSQKEYYELLAFLNNDDEAFMEVPTDEAERKRFGVISATQTLDDAAMVQATNLMDCFAAWEKELPTETNHWIVLDPKEWANFSTKFEKQDDLSLLGGGDVQAGGVMRVELETTLTNITGFRLEALTNANLLYGGPGEEGKGSFLVREFTVEASPLKNPAMTNQIKFRRALADCEAPGFGIANAIDGELEKGGWTPTLTAERRNQNHVAVFECEQPIGYPGGTRLVFTIYQTFKSDDKSGGLDTESKLDCHLLGSFRLSATTNPTPLKIDPLSPDQRQWLSQRPDQFSPEQTRELFDVFRHEEPGFADLNRQIEHRWANWPSVPTTMVLSQRAKPRHTHVFKRGDWLRPDEEVFPATPAVLNPFPVSAPRNRLGLAEWIVDPRSPTTARVMVNRIWQVYFGQGLVTTPEDFGTRVETPSHPELLDWLACEFMRPTVFSAHLSPDWSIKHLQRLIVTSATYRQSSRVTPEIYAKDQFDRLLERGPRVRVDAEEVQDIALSVSGLLNPAIGGPSVFPPIPASVGDTVYSGFSWSESKGEERYRRGLYTFWKRSLPFPSLAAFDAPSAETSCPRRARSNTPLQALTTLNEKTFVEAAQAMAVRVLREGGPDERARARYAFRLCTARMPTPSELEKLLAFWHEQYNHFENDTADAVKVASPDLTNMPPEINLHKVAAWAMVSRAILNLDETISKE
jgi:mono/diheme cytochrome c family protein